MIATHRTIIRAVAGAVLLALSFLPSIAQARCASLSSGTSRPTIVAGATAITVHAPIGRDDAGPLPLVLLLHGSGGTGADMLTQSGLSGTADAHGFIVAAPDGGIAAGPGFVWNIPGVPTVTGTIPTAADRDDVAHLLAIVDSLVAGGCVDPHRVYVTGLSGGGRMTSWLGCVAPRRFGAIAPVVGLRAGNPLASDPTRPDPASCRPDAAIPVIAFAGDKDMTNPIQGGGAGYWRYTMHAAEQRWAILNRCTAAPATRWIAAGVYEERYTGCRDDADVVGRITVGGTHRWVADNDAMWAFFDRHRR